MKKVGHTLILLVFMVACLFLLPTTAQAATVASGTCGDNLTWTLDDTGILTFSGTGAMADYSASDAYAPWWEWRNVITSIILQPGVSNVGGHAFKYCSNVTSVTLPESVTSIGDRAFAECDVGGSRRFMLFFV